MIRLFAILLLASSLMVSVASAGPAEAVLGKPFAHDGLFANAAAGLGYASFENADGREFLTANGFGARLYGKLGYYVIQDLALHANIGYVMFSNFSEERNNLPNYVDHDFYVLSSVYLGVGATYYVPIWENVFFSGSIGFIGYDLDCHKYAGNTGLNAFSFDVEAGKDWWMNEYFALGVSVAFSSGEFWSENDGVFRSSSIMLMFSVKLN